jgi:hypothetical protein
MPDIVAFPAIVVNDKIPPPVYILSSIVKPAVKVPLGFATFNVNLPPSLSLVVSAIVPTIEA